MNLEDGLDSLVAKMRALKRDASAKITYDLMSGALIWSDEKANDLTVEEMGCLRAVLRFRTSIITSEPDERFRHLWTQLVAKYPDWIGFDASRCQANEELAILYHKCKRSSKKYIDNIP
jgi:hypothetical protein